MENAELESIAKKLAHQTRIHEPSAKKVVEILYTIGRRAVEGIAPLLSESEVHERAIKIVREGTQGWGLDHGLKADDDITIAERGHRMDAYIQEQTMLLIEHILRGGNRSSTFRRHGTQ